MKLQLKEVGYKNFLSSGNAYTVLSIDSHKTTLLCGLKGSGKTSLNDAITFTWFNKALRKINKSLLVNTITGKETETYTIFSIGENEYKVLRGIKPNKLEITVNGKELELVSGKDPQEWLEELLGFTFATMKHVILLGNASYTPFMKMDAKERRTVVEDLRGLDIFSTMSKIAKDELSERNKVLSTVNAEVMVLTNKSSMLKTFIEETESNTKSQLDSVDADIKHESSQIEAKQATRDSLISDGKTLAATIIGEPDAIYDELEALKLERQTAMNKKSHLEKTLDEFSSLATCPTCYQVVDGDHKHDIQDKVDNSIFKLSGGIGLITKTIDDLQKSHDHNVKVSNDLDAMRTDLKEINKDVKNHQSSIVKYNGMIERINTAASSISVRKDELMHNEISLSRKQEELLAVKLEIETLQECQKHLKDDGIKASLIEVFIPLFNSLVNKYLDRLDFFVKFELDNEFNETIKSRHRDNFSYYSFSEGEKQTIDIAMLLTWREITMLSGNALTNVLILDEIIDSSLDDTATASMLDILEEMDGNTIVISHKSRDLFQNFERVIEFTKVKNFSTMKDITNE